MGRRASNTVTLATGRVGYSIAQRKGDAEFFVRFKDRTGRYLERTTGQASQQAALDAAEAIIAREYETVNPSATDSWDDVETRLRTTLPACGVRQSSIDKYIRDLGTVRQFYRSTTGPGDVDMKMAKAFRDSYANGTYQRGASVANAKRSRSSHTVFHKLRSLSALWSKWLVRELHACALNPWETIEMPKRDKLEIRYVRDDELIHFYEWLNTRFGGWRLPILFFTVKGLTGCRLWDLCAAEAEHLHEGRLLFPPKNTKARKPRGFPLPADLFAELQAVSGDDYLWGRHTAQLRDVLKKMGKQSHQLNPRFNPRRLYLWIENLMSDYHTAFPERPRFGTHAFRKRAFTKAFQVQAPLKEASITFGCSVDTMLKCYVALEEQEVIDRVGKQMAGILDTPHYPTQKAENPTQNQPGKHGPS